LTKKSRNRHEGEQQEEARPTCAPLWKEMHDEMSSN
jgi:hypothetical protein